MPNVIAIHSIENYDTWIAGEHRARLFKEFCTGYRLYRMPEQNKVALVFENADLDRMKATLGSAEAAAAKASDTVVDPIELFVEIEGAR